MDRHSFTAEDETSAATQLATLRGDVALGQPSMHSPANSHPDSLRSNVPGTLDTPRAYLAPVSSPSSAEPSSSRLATKQSASSKARAKEPSPPQAITSEGRGRKVKCEGLPNPTNTCNNCVAYNYRCTFSSEVDRSRGKYEILESKVETLLSTLRSVVPHIAAQYDKGQLNIMGPSGGSAPPQNATAWHNLQSSGDGGKLDELNGHPDSGAADRESSTRSRAADQRRSSASVEHDRHLHDKAPAAVKRETDRDALIPNVEEGRPRYFGQSSALSLFHSMQAGQQSRPPSPGTMSRPRQVSNRPQTFDSYEPGTAKDRIAGDVSGHDKSVRHSGQTPRPLHPTNSKEWIQLLRRKNTVAVGRDDLNTEEWLTRYTLPAEDLVAHLLHLYFERLSPLMPIVHRPSLERDIATGRAEKDVAFRGFVFTILTITSRFSKDPRVYADPNDPDTAGDHFAAASRLYHQVYAASLINVQVMILTATFMHGAIGPGASWTVLGVAIRALHDIGLHQERAIRVFTPFDQELRRRVFWGAFILDGIFSVNMGRPPGLRLEDCDVRLPLDIDDDALFHFEHGGPITVEKAPRPTVMSGFIHMIRLNILVYDVVSILYTQRWRQDTGNKKLPLTTKVRCAPEYKDMAMLSKRLDEWVAETPQHLRTLESPYKLQAGLVQCGTHDIRLYILKPFLDHAALKKILHPQCSHHARECLKVVLELYEGGHITNLVFIFQQALMSTATFMITVWHECREVERLADDNDLVEATLRTFASFDDRYFSKIFHRAHRILRNTAARAIHTMTSDQRERVSQLLHCNGRPLSALGPRTLLGADPSGRLTVPKSAGFVPSARASKRPNGEDPASDLNQGPLASSNPASSVVPSWSPWGPGVQSPAQGSIDYQPVPPTNLNTFAGLYGFEGDDASVHASGEAPAMRAAVQGPSVSTLSHWTEGEGGALHAHSYGDARGIMPMFTSATDDSSSTAHQLEDLTWTDYFSKFLDDIGSNNQQNTISPSVGVSMGHDTAFAAGSPSMMSVAGGTPRRYGA